MEKIRAFVALEMPDEVRRDLDEISFRLRKDLANVPLRWVPVENMHLTLKFLGDVLREQLQAITEILREKTGNLAPIQLSLDGLGAFPNLQRPRVLWIGIDFPDTLKTFQRDLENQFAALGFSHENRSFAPHLTLARVRGHARTADLARIREILEAAPKPAPTHAIADKITLFRSELKPSGSVYNALSQFVLTNKN